MPGAQKDTMKKVNDFIHRLIQVISKGYTRYSQTRGQILYDDISSNKLKYFALANLHFINYLMFLQNWPLEV